MKQRQHQQPTPLPRKYTNGGANGQSAPLLHLSRQQHHHHQYHTSHMNNDAKNPSSSSSHQKQQPTHHHHQQQQQKQHHQQQQQQHRTASAADSLMSASVVRELRNREQLEFIDMIQRPELFDLPVVRRCLREIRDPATTASTVLSQHVGGGCGVGGVGRAITAGEYAICYHYNSKRKRQEKPAAGAAATVGGGAVADSKVIV